MHQTWWRPQLVKTLKQPKRNQMLLNKHTLPFLHPEIQELFWSSPKTSPGKGRGGGVRTFRNWHTQSPTLLAFAHNYTLYFL